MSELAGRPDHWIMGVKQPDNSTLRFPNWWGPWASYNSCIYKTWSDDGQTPGGFRTINCNNSWGIYAFHTGGANALFVDGSVHFLAEGLDQTCSPRWSRGLAARLLTARVSNCHVGTASCWPDARD